MTEVIGFNHTQDPISAVETSVPLGAKSNGGGVVDSYGVRRLTPLECERLQGFPDGWTNEQPDRHRYHQLGNSVAVPVFEWVAARLVEVDEARREIGVDAEPGLHYGTDKQGE